MRTVCTVLFSMCTRCLSLQQRQVISGKITPTHRWNKDGRQRWATNRDTRKFTLLIPSRQNSDSLLTHRNALLVFLDFCRLLRIAQIRSISPGMIGVWAKYLLLRNGGEGINKHAEPWAGILPVLCAFHSAANPHTYLIRSCHLWGVGEAAGLTAELAMRTSLNDFSLRAMYLWSLWFLTFLWKCQYWINIDHLYKNLLVSHASHSIFNLYVIHLTPFSGCPFMIYSSLTLFCFAFVGLWFYKRQVLFFLLRNN